MTLLSEALVAGAPDQDAPNGRSAFPCCTEYNMWSDERRISGAMLYNVHHIRKSKGKTVRLDSVMLYKIQHRRHRWIERG